jgi:hypothetical protein
VCSPFDVEYFGFLPAFFFDSTLKYLFLDSNFGSDSAISIYVISFSWSIVLFLFSKFISFFPSSASVLRELDISPISSFIVTLFSFFVVFIIENVFI